MNPQPFGLVAQLSNTRITLPLIHVETRFRVTGETAVVEMDQVFEQSARESLDVTYTFPLPSAAAVYRCEMIVNGRVVRAVVMEEEAARRVVAAKKAEGRRTALAERNRENLFTLQLGNAAPGDRLVIRFAYLEALDRLGPQLSLRIAFSPGVRYIPGKPLLRQNRGLGWQDDTDQVPDASRLSPPRIAGDHPDAATLFLHGTLDADEIDITTVGSPTHPAVVRPEEALVEVELCGDEHLPDRDFVLRWEESPATEPRPKAWITEHADGQRYGLLQLRAPQADAVPARDDFAQDIYFLLDRSGSMTGQKWEKCAEALHAFVNELGVKDRIWITCFESQYQDFAEAPLSRDAILADPRFQKLVRLGTGGGTELRPALEHVLAKRTDHSASRPARLILITDGQVGNEDEITRLMRKPASAGLPVHTFGIDSAVNDAFLKTLARQTGGRCTLMTPDDDIPAAVKKLAVTLRRPVLTQVRLEGEHRTVRETNVLPDLHAGEVLLLPLRLGSDRAAITAQDPDGRPWTRAFDLAESASDADNPAPRLLWAHRRIRHLLSEDRAAEAIELAIAHNLACRGASFVAWDDAEKVPVAKREVYQPSIERDERIMRCSMGPSDVADDPFVGSVFRKELNFFESKVTGYEKARSLRECSDDELLDDRNTSDMTKPAAAPAAPERQCYVSGPDSTGLTPLQRHAVFTYFPLYGHRLPRESDTAQRLHAWARPFSEFLMERLNLPEAIAVQITVILRAWAMRSGPKRSQKLETWFIELQASADPVDLLQRRLATTSPDLELEHALELLQVGLLEPRQA